MKYLLILILLSGCAQAIKPVNGYYTPDLAGPLPADLFMLHEELHTKGMGHCWDSDCLMSPVYEYDLIFGVKRKQLCSFCKLKI